MKRPATLPWRAATGWGDDMSDLIRIFTERGDLAHLALLLWALAASAAFLVTLRELAAASRRFDEFVRQLSRFNRRAKGNRSLSHFISED